MTPEVEEQYEELTCAYCREWWHFPGSHPKAGEQIFGPGGTPQKRPATAPPICEGCPKGEIWTDESRAIHGAYLDVRMVGGSSHVYFRLLYEADREIDNFQLAEVVYGNP